MTAGYRANHNGGYLPQTPAHTSHINVTRKATNPTRPMLEANLRHWENDEHMTTSRHVRAQVRGVNHQRGYPDQDNTMINQPHRAQVQVVTAYSQLLQNRNRLPQGGLPASGVDRRGCGSRRRIADSKIGDAASLEDVRMYLRRN